MRNNDICDEVIVKIGQDIIDYPYECDIGTECSYYYKNGNKFIDSDACPCNGIAEATTSHCFWRDGMAYDAYDPEWFQYDSSDCSGSDAHRISYKFDECHNVSESDMTDYNAYKAIH